MKNIKRKLQLIQDSKYALYGKISFINYLKLKHDNYVLSDSELEFYNANSEYNVDLDKIFTKKELVSLRQLFDAHRQKVCRLKKKIKYMFKRCPFVYFITLTWRDELLENTKASTRRTYVRRFLSGLDYVDFHANIDFGHQTLREHYHAVLCSYSPIESLDWHYGFSNIQHVKSSSADFGRVAQYINKLTFHAVKESTGLNRCITPRKTNYFNLPFKESLL